MKWDLLISTAQHPEFTAQEVIQRSIKMAKLAEKLDFDTAWILEHHFTHYGILPSPFGMAGYLLGATTKLKVGTAISTVTLDHPIRSAENVAALDQLSEGRFIFGIGRGGFLKDFKAFGIDPATSRERMGEYMDVIHQAWSTGRASADGEFVKFDEVPILPETYTKNGPPVYTVATSPSSMEWSAKRGYPMLMNWLFEDEEKVSDLEYYSEIAAEAGYDPESIDHALNLLVCVTDNKEETLATSRKYLHWWMDEYVRATQLYDADKQGLKGYEYHQDLWKSWAHKKVNTTDERVNRAIRLNVIGSKQECIERLYELIKLTKLNRFICAFENLGETDKVLESIRIFKEEVVPEVEKLIKADKKKVAKSEQKSLEAVAEI
jgi:alkanal monooxygenase alpha chain